jgi:hypothetical protein
MFISTTAILRDFIPVPLHLILHAKFEISYSCGVVGTATGRPRGRSSSPGRVKNFNFSKSSSPALEATKPPTLWVPVALSPGVKRQEREADHSPPISAEVKKKGIYTFTPPHAFMV